VGELALASLRERMSRLPNPVRVFGLGVGDSARLDLLAGLARGAFAERITDGAQAARAALRVLEEAERPVWLGTTVALGPNVERVFPRDASALVGGETLWVLGRSVAGKPPTQLKLTNAAGIRELALAPVALDDRGDLGRRWAEARLAQMLEDGEGRAALVDLGMRHGIITPVTSFYVPTAAEMSPEERAELAGRREGRAVGEAARSNDRRSQPISTHALELESKQARRAAAAESTAGDDKEGGTGRRYAAAGPKDDKPAERELEAAAPPPAAEGAAASTRDRQRALREASEFGMIGLAQEAPATASARGDTPAAKSGLKAGEVAADALTYRSAPSTPIDGEKASRTTAKPAMQDSASALGDMWGDELAGGLGSIATLPHGAAGHGAIDSTGRGDSLGAGHGRLGGGHATSAPKVRLGDAAVVGSLPREVIQRIVRQNFGRFRTCYEQGLARDPKLAGRLTVRFTIGRDGGVSNAADGGSSVNDSAVQACIVSSVHALAFPSPETGIATVTLPITLEPGDGAKRGAPRPAVLIGVFLGDLPRTWFGCSAAAKIPLEDRVALWRERLAAVAGNVQGAIAVYRNALASCEAYTARERQRLLALMLDAVPGIPAKVDLYRAMLNDRGASDVLYRGLLARIKTPEEMRALHGALGLKNLDPGILAKLVADTWDPAERAARLRALAREFPDDFALNLALLDALEDAGDRARVADAARRLRERPDADASARTALGELYLRLAARAESAAKKASWVAEAQRAFGEIVEFAPEDPVARRRLGDLLLAHGFFADAGRQYETLARLTPDEPKVLLLRAAAAQGQGLLEEALRWTEKGGAAGAPDADSGAAVTARALAATYLAWARAEARAAKREDELTALTARAARVLASGRADPAEPHGARVSLTWSHPELHPTLWTNALGAPMPAPEGDVTLGILQALVPERDSSLVEVRLEPDDVAHAARLGAVAELTVVFDELGKTEKIVRVPVRFQRSGPATRRFSLAGKEVQGG
jgi:Ca-activated chloride channel family protein